MPWIGTLIGIRKADAGRAPEALAVFDRALSAREKLAKVSGIILAHPGLKIEVEGHTDSTGGPAINQPLSERRAQSEVHARTERRGDVQSAHRGEHVP